MPGLSASRLAAAPSGALTRWLCAGYAGFIVYGSLLPFDFRPLDPAAAWALFEQTPFLQLDVGARADWIANGVLYAPLGVLLARLLGGDGRGGWRRAVGLSIAGLLCAALAVAVEYTQLFFPPRTVSQNDLLAECLGSAVGIVATPLLTPWWNRFRATWLGDGQRVAQHLLQAYAAAYLLFCFFPYDLLLSAPEWHDKLRSDAWGWLVATPNGWAWPRAALQWVAEAALTMPLGWLLPAGGGRTDGRRRVLRAALAGALLGVAIEAGQLLIETGISQGVSVLSRALGVAAGAWAQRALAAGGVEPLRRWLARHAWPLAAAYGALLSVVNGWWRHPRQGPGGVAGSWAQLHLMPFYYHYFTSEAIALYSLCSVVAMYLPLAALCWSRRVPAGRAALLVGVTAAVMEAGKLLLTDTHPDPTNALIAGASCGLLLSAVQRWRGRFGATPPGALAGGIPPAAAAGGRWQPAAPLADSTRPDTPWRRAWVLPVLPAALLGTLLLPLPLPVLLLAFGVVAGSAAAVWRRPLLLLAIVPAALPVFDLAPLSGRFFWDEFDWLMAACLAVGWFRTPPDAAVPVQRRRLSTVAFAVLAAALAVSTLRGLAPLSPLDANAFAHYYSHFNALRIAKGAVWAWLFVACWRRLAARRPDAAAARFAFGVDCGLALTVLVVLWERAAFAGWLDFAANYRVTGPVSAMHKGGAYIECFLAVAAACALAPLLRPRSGRVATAAAVVLLAGASYALMVTFSRNGYAAFAWVLGAGSMAAVTGRQAGSRRRRGALLAAVALAAAIGAVVLNGPYARERLSHIGQDLATRQAHWADALAMRDAGLATQVFGMGLGRFPETHFWRSREAAHAAGFRLEHDADDDTFLRLGSGAPVYFEQIVGLPASGPLTIRARLRSAAGTPALSVMLCRKWLLTSKDCEEAELTLAPTAAAPPAGWQTVSATLPALPPSASRWPVPVKLSLVTPTAGTVIDIDDIRLLDDGGVDRLTNGDFSAGMDRWFFATDIDPPWHIHNLAVAILFEQGWFGLAAWAGVVVAALAGGWRNTRRGGAAAAAALPALIGLGAFLVSGSLNTLIDAPRFLWLLLVLAWLCTVGQPPRRDDGGLPATPGG